MRSSYKVNDDQNPVKVVVHEIGRGKETGCK